MADRDLLDYIDESELKVNHAANRRLKMGRSSRARQKSVRKSGNLRMLYTPKESFDWDDNDGTLPEPHSKRVRLATTSCTDNDGTLPEPHSKRVRLSTSCTDNDGTLPEPHSKRVRLSTTSCTDNDGTLPEPHSKRVRLSTTSCTTTIGDGSRIDSSFDVVDETPGISGTKVLPFQSRLNKSTVVSERSLKVVPKPMQQHKTVRHLFNNNMEGLVPISGSSETHADGQNAVNVVDNSLFRRSERKSPSVSGITRLQVTKISAMSSKGRVPICSVGGNSSVTTNRMYASKTETADHNKLAQLVQISELTWTSHRAEQAASTHKPQHLNEEEDELPATQPVSSLLLKGQYKQQYNLKFTSLS